MTGKDRYEIILAGSGGQGLVVSGIMLGEGAILDGKNVVQTVSYGIASRGGFSQAEVIIDQDEIIFQQVLQPDVVLALTEEAMDMYSGLAPAGTLVFYDSTLLKSRPGDNLSGYPFTQMAAEHGHAGTANMIALGAISAATGLVKTQSLIRVTQKRFSPQIAAINVRALYSGVGLVTGGPGRS
ncbi:MAG TPA: 2-oxoacid:acceptor oxidoreductase family protein [Spirochaetia bacterium]|nr:2-oxoacid:acceptor oxidoreductase family protein [Spirochaetia bacterium]